MRLLPLVLFTTLSGAQAANPAPLNGLWKLTQFAGDGTGPRLPRPAGELFIVSGQVRGNSGCGRYVGSLDAARSALRMQASVLPPRPAERCLYAVRGNFTDTLNAARQCTLSRDHLVLFSTVGRLTFERVGFVTPANK